MDKPVVKQKPKPPPYPRPVPQLVIEELPPGPKDIAWNAINGGEYYIDEDELARDETEVEKRAAKRRKIEACANACLRGQPLFIMSAQLKGPFKKGWRNPWAKQGKISRSSNVARDKQIEIPETGRKIPSSVEEEDIKDVKSELPHSRLASRGSAQWRGLNKDVVLGTAPSPFTSRVQKTALGASPQVPRQTKDTRVKEWLRTNRADAVDPEDEILVHSSPTPVARQRRTSGQWQDIDNRPHTSQSEPSRIMSPYQNSPKTVVSLQDQGFGRLSGAEKRIQQLSRDIQNIVAEPVISSSRDPHVEDGKPTSIVPGSKNFLPSTRAEFAILKAKRSVPQTAPANAHLSPFEFRKVCQGNPRGKEQIPSVTNAGGNSPIALRSATNLGHNDHLHIDSNNEDNEPRHPVADASATTVKPNEDIFLTAPPTSVYSSAVPQQDVAPREKEETAANETDPVTNSNSRPALSNAVSELGTTDLLPSAQPRPEQDQVLSSNNYDEKLRSIKHPTSASEHATQDGVKATDDATNPTVTGREAPGQQKPADDMNGASTPVLARDAMELNTQEMLANIEPLELSTVKKPKHVPKKQTPATATRTKSDKKRKKTSFALETSSAPSHASIKNIMKARVSKTLASPPMFLLNKEDLDIEVSDDENESMTKRSRRLSSLSKPKSILKSNNPSSSPTSIRRLKRGLSSGYEQSGQNGLEEDKFDLDAAIDDLGSFLGTWDAEKEASSLEIEL